MVKIESILLRIHQLEHLLRKQYYANGQGLAELIVSCESRLPQSIVVELQTIAQHRQSLFDDDYTPQQQNDLLQLCIECERRLIPRAGRLIWGIAWSLMAIVTMLALFSYAIYWDDFTWFRL